MVIVARLVWVAIATSLQRALARHGLITYEWGGWRNALLVGWTGMRGAVSLAAALALPSTIASGAAFADRSRLIGVTFGVILFTLVGQGLTLTPLIQLLGIRRDGDEGRELRTARRAMTLAALERLYELAVLDDIPGALIAEKRARLEQQLERLNSRDGRGEHGENSAGRETSGWIVERVLRREVLSAERRTLIRLRNQGEINDEVRRLERDLDLEEQHEDQHIGG